MTDAPDDPDPFPLSDSDLAYSLIIAMGRVAEAAGPLLAWLQPYGQACRLCHQLDRDGHDPVMPCGQLRARIEALGATVRRVTSG